MSILAGMDLDNTKFKKCVGKTKKMHKVTVHVFTVKHSTSLSVELKKMSDA